jgi:hypothetical protein
MIGSDAVVSPAAQLQAGELGKGLPPPTLEPLAERPSKSLQHNSEDRCIGTSVFGTILMRSIPISLRQNGSRHVRAMPFCRSAADHVSASEQDSP